MKTKVYAALAVMALPVTAFAIPPGLLYDEDVTPQQENGDLLFGTGNANGGFTVFRDATLSLELGLRAKLRFDPDDGFQPKNVFNSQGDGTYVMPAGTPHPVTGFGPDTPLWNLEWSIDTAFDGGSAKLADYSFVLALDTDPSAATSFSTISGGDILAGATWDPFLFPNAAQGSDNYGFDGLFEPIAAVPDIDPSAEGTYTISLSAYNKTLLGKKGKLVGHTEIDVNVVPEPAAVAAWMGLAGFGLVLWRRLCRSR